MPDASGQLMICEEVPPEPADPMPGAEIRFKNGRHSGSMTVTVNDREADHRKWGQPGLFSPTLRTVTISDRCPKCGGPRGKPTSRPYYEDGCYYAVDRWVNPCGHQDLYPDVLAEAKRFVKEPK